MIGRIKNDNLTHNLLDYLMGEDEIGVPKEPIYTYKVINLNSKLERFTEFLVYLNKQQKLLLPSPVKNKNKEITKLLI